MAIENNLKTQGRYEREETLKYRGKYEEGKPEGYYLENDVVRKDDGKYYKFDGTDFDEEVENFEEKILNYKYESGDSVFYELLNQSIKTPLAVSTPLFTFLKDYYSGNEVINENSNINTVKNIMNTSLKNLVPYAVLNGNQNLNRTNAILKDLSTEYVDDKTIDIKIDYAGFNKTNYTTGNDTFRLTTDDTLKFYKDGNINRITHRTVYNELKDYINKYNIEDWGNSIILNSYKIDKYGHIKEINDFRFYNPKRPYFEEISAVPNVKSNIDITNTSNSNLYTEINENLTYDIAEYFNDYIGKTGAILELTFLPSNDYNKYPKEVKIYLDSTQFKSISSGLTYITPFLRYTLKSYTPSSGYGGGITYYALKFEFRPFYYKFNNYEPIEYNNDFNDGSFKVDTLYKIKIKYLRY